MGNVNHSRKIFDVVISQINTDYDDINNIRTVLSPFMMGMNEYLIPGLSIQKFYIPRELFLFIKAPQVPKYLTTLFEHFQFCLRRHSSAPSIEIN